MPTCDALLTYAWCRSGYTALRSLSRMGLRVALADAVSRGMGQGSRLKSAFYPVAPPLSQPEAFIAGISAALRDSGGRFLLPGHDETALLARFRDRLPPGVVLPVAAFEQIELANDKQRMANLAGSIGLPVPAWLNWSDLPDLKAQLSARRGPWVIKLRRGNSAKGVFYPADNQEALELCARLIEEYQLPPQRYPIVQQRVEGEGWGVSCLYWHGERLATFTHHRLREKTATGGTSTLRVSARNPLIESAAHRLLDEMRWHGLAMVEFKYHSASDQGWFIEVNPRLWGSIHLAVAAGVDFPALLYTAAMEGPERARQMLKPWREGLVARWYLGDCIAAAGQLKRGKLASALRMLLPGGAGTYDDWFWDDPGAMLGQAVYYLSAFLRSRSLNPEEEGMLG